MQTSELIWTDTHCHLYADAFDADRTIMIQHAIKSGVHAMMLPNIDHASISGMHALATEFPRHCFPMIGLHPCSVGPDYKQDLARLYAQLNNADYVGIGETGIDLYWDVTYRNEQIDAFETQIQWAKENQLPVIIHSRESLDLNIEIIQRHQDGRLKGIFHCFTGSVEQGKRIEGMGFYMGIGGVITYKNSSLPAVVRSLPPSSVVLETDAPYLPPVPYRGKRNESAYIPLIAERLAEALEMPLAELSVLTERNASLVFQKKR